MSNDWIIDVLTDLSRFARTNGLVALAEQLEDTKLVAAAELVAAASRTPSGTAEDAAAPVRLHRTLAGGREH